MYQVLLREVGLNVSQTKLIEQVAQVKDHRNDRRDIYNLDYPQRQCLVEKSSLMGRAFGHLRYATTLLRE
jgi:hypothetical protein